MCLYLIWGVVKDAQRSGLIELISQRQRGIKVGELKRGLPSEMAEESVDTELELDSLIPGLRTTDGKVYRPMRIKHKQKISPVVQEFNALYENADEEGRKQLKSYLNMFLFRVF